MLAFASFENGGNGWYQAAKASTQAPNQVQLYAAQMIGNGILSGRSNQGTLSCITLARFGSTAVQLPMTLAVPKETLHIVLTLRPTRAAADECLDRWSPDGRMREYICVWRCHLRQHREWSDDRARQISRASTWIAGTETKAPAPAVGSGFSSGVLYFGPGNKYNFRAQHVKTDGSITGKAASFY